MSRPPGFFQLPSWDTPRRAHAVARFSSYLSTPFLGYVMVVAELCGAEMELSTPFLGYELCLLLYSSCLVYFQLPSWDTPRQQPIRSSDHAAFNSLLGILSISVPKRYQFIPFNSLLGIPRTITLQQFRARHYFQLPSWDTSSAPDFGSGFMTMAFNSLLGIPYEVYDAGDVSPTLSTPFLGYGRLSQPPSPMMDYFQLPSWDTSGAHQPYNGC